MIQRRGSPNTAEEYLKHSSFSLKFYTITSALILLIAWLIPEFIEPFIDRPELTIWHLQLWRLVLSIFGQVPGFFSLVVLGVCFVWMYGMMKDDKCSTVYRLVEVMIINVQIHVVFNLISLVFTILFDTSQLSLFEGFGWFSLIIIYEFRLSIIEPQKQRRLFCLPILVKNKYYPWIILAIIILLTSQLFFYLSCGIVGYYQQIIRKQMIIKLTIQVYYKIQSWFPQSITNRYDFIKIQKVQQDVKLLCVQSINQMFLTKKPILISSQQNTINTSNVNKKKSICRKERSKIKQDQLHSFSQNQTIVNLSATGLVANQNVESSQNDMKGSWENQEDRQPTKTIDLANIEIQPHETYTIQHNDQSNQTQQSQTTLNDNNPPNQQLLSKQQNENKKNMEGQKKNLI